MNYLSVLNKDFNLANSINFNGKYISLNRECNLKHWNSFFDKKSNVQIMILGRPVIESSDWQQIKEYEENYITKFLIKKYVDLEIEDFCSQLNGAFSVLVIDYRFNKILIITDKLGIYPIYMSLLVLGVPARIQSMARFTASGVDIYCSMMFDYSNNSKASLESSVEADTPTEAHIYGEKG